MSRKKTLVIVAIVLTLIIGCTYYANEVNLFIESYYSGIGLADKDELMIISILFALLPIALIVSNLIISKNRTVYIVWGIIIAAYAFVPVVNAIQGNKNILRITQIESDLSVVMRSDTTFSRIYLVDLPIGLEISNKALWKRELAGVEYYSNDSILTNDWPRWRTLYDVYLNTGDSLSRLTSKRDNMGKKILKGRQTKKYIAYKRHRINSSPSIQFHFLEYLEKMKSERKDTLHVGSIEQFKHENPLLFGKLMTGDSICVRLRSKKYSCSNTLSIDFGAD